jgi:hypothetical protein
MAKCANCTTEAVHQYRVTPEFKIDYCNSHLPSFLRAQQKAGLLKPPAVVEAPVVVEEAAEETVVEETAPETKTTKKKTSSVG